MSKLNFKPHMRLNVYRNDNHEYYLETQQAKLKNGKVLFGAATPVQKNNMERLAKAMMANVHTANKGYVSIPEDVIFHGSSAIAILVPSQVRKLKFSKTLKIASGEFPVPPCIFVYSPGSLSVFALKQAEKPTDDTEMFKAPFYNVGKNGNICMGNNDMNELKKVKGTYQQAKIAVELFFASEFHHYQDIQKLQDVTLESLYREKKGRFNKKQMISHAKTFKQIIIPLD